MASCSSPITIELLSESENESSGDASSQNNFEPFSSQRSEVFRLDCAEDDFPQVEYDLIDQSFEKNSPNRCGSPSDDQTIIYSPEIPEPVIPVDVPEIERPVSSQKTSGPSKTIEKESDELTKEQLKVEKQRLRQEKKAEELKKKRIRAALTEKHRSLRPEENIKLFTITIDTNIVNSQYGGIVLTSLQQSGIQCIVENHIKPHTVSWKKKLGFIVSDEGIIQENAKEKEENQLLYIINSDELVNLVASNELLTHIQMIKSAFLDKDVTLVIIGMKKYFDSQKTKKKFESSAEGRRKVSKNHCEPRGSVEITKEGLQIALIELQLIGKCNHRLIETAEELASLIITVTKSLSQLDYKREKQQREEGDLEWFAKADAKSCVKVDTNGNGLLQLWQLQIQQFYAVGAEAANAIVSNFHSPLALLNRYKSCSTTSEAELLLQNVHIRRGPGFFASTRRIGPELSKKVFHFYTSDDPDMEL